MKRRSKTVRIPLKPSAIERELDRYAYKANWNMAALIERGEENNQPEVRKRAEILLKGCSFQKQGKLYE